jgi:epoxyqueuosine reductase
VRALTQDKTEPAQPPGQGTESSTAATDDRPLYPDGVRPHLDLLDLLRMSHETYVETFRGTAIKRAKVWMLRRNAAVALGNVGAADSTEALVEAMRRDEHPIVRGHAAWALGRLAIRHNVGSIRRDLGAALAAEGDADVREEIQLALHDLDGMV